MVDQVRDSGHTSETAAVHSWHCMTISRDLASLSTGHGEEACRWGHPEVAALDEGFPGASHAKSVEE